MIIRFRILGRHIPLSPSQILVIGFGIIIFLGTILLNLPIASSNGSSTGFINSLFTSTSAVCITGLVVVDTATHWSSFGHLVIIILIQIGGLGFMTMSTLLSMAIGRRITLRERIIMQQALNLDELDGLVRLTRSIILATLIIEVIGAAFYSAVFVPEHGLKGFAMGLFHSVSAFCNAGFDLIGDFSSFNSYISNMAINVITMLLIIIGGIGFTVWKDVYHYREIRRLSLHSKMVISVTSFLILIGAVLIFIAEYNNTGTIGNLSLRDKIVSSLFHSVSLRTAGFNTISIEEMKTSSKILTMILMFIGGSPCSTAGGIKTTTVGILFFTVISVIKGHEDTEAFEKRISKTLVYRALAITAIGLLMVITVTMILSISEKGDFLTLFFEAVSAAGTAGSSLSFSPRLTLIGKVTIAITMFAGRIGPLTLVIALAQKASRNKGSIKYPEDKILVG